MAYRSDESGKWEIYVQSFPTPGSKYQVSTSGGGGVIAWVRGGHELLFTGGDGFTLMAADMETSPTIRIGAPRRLFKLPPYVVGRDVTPDGQRVLVVVPAGQATAATITIEQNWTAAVKRP